MIKYFSMVMLSLTLVACSSQDRTTTSSTHMDNDKNGRVDHVNNSRVNSDVNARADYDTTGRRVNSDVNARADYDTTGRRVGNDYNGRIDNDNTGKNVRDRDSAAITPLDQSESEADRTITQKIRKAVVADDALSTNAQNIKIITINGVVVLRGPVANQQEIDSVLRKISDVQGVVRVDNQLEILKK